MSQMSSSFGNFKQIFRLQKHSARSTLEMERWTPRPLQDFHMCRRSCDISNVDTTQSARESRNTCFSIYSTEQYSSRRQWLPTAGSSLPQRGALLEIQSTDKTVITTLPQPLDGSQPTAPPPLFELSKGLESHYPPIHSVCRFTLCFRSVP